MLQTRGSKVSPYTGLWGSDGCDLWTLVFSISQHFTHCKLYIFWTYVTIQLIWAYFNWNRTILKNWPLYKRSMTFSYFVLYFDNATSHRYHVIDFFTPYNKRNNMTCFTTELKHFEFSNTCRGSPRHHWRGSVCTFHIVSPESHNQCITGNLSR